MKTNKNSAVKYLIVVILILLIFGIIAKLVNKFTKTHHSVPVNRIVHLQQDFTKSDNFILLALAGALLLSVFYMIYNFYRNEQALIEHGNKAELNALSKSRFLANMSHEIRTPLNSIIGFSEQLTQVNLEHEQQEQIGLIRNSSVLLLEVVNNILDFSKYESGKVVLQQTAFSPLSVIHDVFNNMKIHADNKKICFVKCLQIEKDIYLRGDPLRLKQVIMNLLSNAIKFTANGAVILRAELLKTCLKKSLLKVSVSDTGAGINHHDQKIIFDEFAQGYYSPKTKNDQGTGLGLAICKKIVEFQGGIINVTSEEKKGSVFCFELPYENIDKPDAEETNCSFKNIDVDFLKLKRILLADDNLLNVLLTSAILKKYKVSFDTAYNGLEAYELFNKNEYDLILTDIQMPEMGGIELTKKIRTAENLKKRLVPILGVTANVQQEERNNYIESGINELILKPFLEQELIEKLMLFLK